MPIGHPDRHTLRQVVPPVLYDDLAHMETDPDLESLHDHPDFQALLGE